MEFSKDKKLAIILGVFALVIVTTAASFAFFTYSRVGQTTTTITSGDIEFSFIEGESAGLTNAFPVSDEIGAQDTSEEYTFTVNLKSSSATNKATYNVYLVDNNDVTQDDQGNPINYFTSDQIKFALIKDEVFVAGTTAEAGRLVSSVTGFTAGTTQGEGLVLENQEIASGKTDSYKLRIWISDDVNYSNTTLTDDTTDVNNDAQTSTGKYNGFKYSLKVKVTSGAVNLSGITTDMIEYTNENTECTNMTCSLDELYQKIDDIN